MKLLSSDIGQASRSPCWSVTSATMQRIVRLVLNYVVFTSTVLRPPLWAPAERPPAGSGRCTHRVCTNASGAPRRPACPGSDSLVFKAASEQLPLDTTTHTHHTCSNTISQFLPLLSHCIATSLTQKESNPRAPSDGETR